MLIAFAALARCVNVCLLGSLPPGRAVADPRRFKERSRAEFPPKSIDSRSDRFGSSGGDMSQVAALWGHIIDNSRRNHDGGCRTHPRRAKLMSPLKTPLSNRADLDLRRQPRHEGRLFRFVLHSGHLAVEQDPLARLDPGLVEAARMIRSQGSLRQRQTCRCPADQVGRSSPDQRWPRARHPGVFFACPALARLVRFWHPV